MTQMSPGLDAALAAPHAIVFVAVEIVLPDATMRLIFGSGLVAFDGKTFAGEDATYGSLMTLSDVEDGIGDQAPACTLTIAPRTDTAAIALSTADKQGSPVTMWLGALDPVSGLVVDEPYHFFAGSIDVPTLKGEPGSFTVELEITSEFEQFFLNDDGARLSPAYHQYCWPGENGMKFVLNVTRQIYWGSSPTSGVSL